MERIDASSRDERPVGLWILAGVILVAAVAFVAIWSLPDDGRRDVLYFAQDYIPIVMFLSLACLLFSGFPVAFILGGLAILFGLIGYFLGIFSLIEFFNFLPRIWGQAAENLVLVAVPAFVFMGVMMERSGIATDLLYCVQVLLKRVPGALALGGDHHGHHPRRDDRNHRRLGHHDDRPRAPDDAEAEVQSGTLLRGHRGLRHPGDP